MILRKTKKSKNGVEELPSKKLKAATTQNSLQYKYLYENGIMHVVEDVYSRTYDLLPITYTTATDTEQKIILSQYNSALNQLSNNDHFQLTLLVKKTPKGEYMEENAYAPRTDGFDHFREEFNTIIEDNYDKGHNNFKVGRFITLSTHAANQRDARRNLESMSDNFSEELRAIKSGLTPLEAMERLQVMNDILRPGAPLYGDYSDLEKQKLRSQDLIAPGVLNFNRPGKISFGINDKEGEVLFLRDYPRNLSDSMFKELTEAGIEMVLTIHGSPYSIAETNQSLRTASMDVEGEVLKQRSKSSHKGSGGDYIARGTREYYEDVNEQIDFVTETGDTQFSTTIMVYTWADNSDELRHNIQQINAVGKKFGANFEPFYLTQEQALNSILPLGKNYMDFEKSFVRDLLTPNLSVNSPYTSQDIQHKGGKFYGINLLSKNNILINRMSDELKNSNGGIMAVSGGGKSFAAKNEIISTLLARPKDEVIILDPEREYIPIAKEFKGQVVHVGPGSPVSINALDLEDTEGLGIEGNPIADKANFLLSIFGNILGRITPTQRTLIDRVTKEVYRQYDKPNLQDWFGVLKENQSEEARDLVGGLGIYIEGSLNMFAKNTNVDLNSRLTIYDTNSLKNEMAVFGYMVILDKIWNKVVENRRKGIVTWVYIDEFQILINPNQIQQLREAASNIYARIRKYGGNPTFMTQSAETMAATLEGRNIMFNSDFLILLQQKSGVLKALIEEFNLTDKQASYLSSPAAGAGLIIAGSNIIPFSNKIPKQTALFKLMDTKVNNDRQTSAG